MAGKRLTCPICRDTVFVSLAELAEAGGKVQCANHWVGVEMVDLAALMEILCGASTVPPDGKEEELCEVGDRSERMHQAPKSYARKDVLAQGVSEEVLFS